MKGALRLSQHAIQEEDSGTDLVAEFCLSDRRQPKNNNTSMRPPKNGKAVRFADEGMDQAEHSRRMNEQIVQDSVEEISNFSAEGPTKLGSKAGAPGAKSAASSQATLAMEVASQFLQSRKRPKKDSLERTDMKIKISDRKIIVESGSKYGSAGRADRAGTEGDPSHGKVNIDLARTFDALDQLHPPEQMMNERDAGDKLQATNLGRDAIAVSSGEEDASDSSSQEQLFAALNRNKNR